MQSVLVSKGWGAWGAMRNALCKLFGLRRTGEVAAEVVRDTRVLVRPAFAPLTLSTEYPLK